MTVSHIPDYLKKFSLILSSINVCPTFLQIALLLIMSFLSLPHTFLHLHLLHSIYGLLFIQHVEP